MTESCDGHHCGVALSYSEVSFVFRSSMVEILVCFDIFSNIVGLYYALSYSPVSEISYSTLMIEMLV